MIKIKFSLHSNGACPLCVHYKKCHILEKLEETLKKNCSPVYDDTMEIVIYRCPEFEELP